MLGRWKSARRSYGERGETREASRAEMLALLCRLGESALLDRFISGIVTKQYDGRGNAALIAAVPFLGAERTGDLFSVLASAAMRRHASHSIVGQSEHDHTGVVRRRIAADVGEVDIARDERQAIDARAWTAMTSSAALRISMSRTPTTSWSSCRNLWAADKGEAVKLWRSPTARAHVPTGAAG